MSGSTIVEAPYPRAGYAWYVVAVLVLAYVFSFIDRQILTLLVDPIRRDLAVSDTQVSLLYGFAFAILYAVAGLPIGRLVDRANRRTIAAIGIAVWSVMTAACGLAHNFWELFGARVGVGIGEAALAPAAYSILSDYFAPQRRAVALGVYAMGIYIGAGLAVVIAGVVFGLLSATATVDLPWLGPTPPWKAVFFAIGLPGLLIALLALTIREPARREVLSRGAADATLGATLRYFWSERATFAPLYLGYACAVLVSYGLGAWIPSFFIRTYGWSAADAGKGFGLVVMIFGSLGAVGSGALGDRWTNRGRRDAKVRLTFYAAIVTLPCVVAFPLAPSAPMALAVLCLSVFAGAAISSLGGAAVQDLVPNQMRGQATALYILVITLIGLGFGPTAIALVTDVVFHDDKMLRYSIVAIAVPFTLAAVLLLARAVAPYRRMRDRLILAAGR